MRGLLGILLLLFGLPAMPSAAATLNVTVAGASMKPVADAVVVLHSMGKHTPAPELDGPYSIDQRHIKFHPFVAVVPVNALVTFPNFDPVRHHVYSFSPAKRFELKLYAKDQTRSVKLDRAGVVALGCNIHDSMSAFVFVTDSVWTVKTDTTGRASFSGLEHGKYRMTVWHPYLRAPGNQLVKIADVGGSSRSEAVSVSLRAPPRHDMSRY